MARSILIIEDDLSLGKSLTETLKRRGYDVTWARDSESALSMSGLKNFDLALVDCMLPKVNGVELLQRMKKGIGDLPIILMSGVYKDKSFIQASIDKTEAIAFLSKPFNVDDLLTIITDQLEDTSWQEYSFVVPVHQMDNEDSRFLTKRISGLTSINGLHLIQLLSEMMRKKVSGSLNLSHSEKNFFCEIILSKGDVQKILLDDKESYFGILLVELGFIAQEDLDQALEEPSYKPLGEKLVDLNTLSPHAIHLVRNKQFAIRISRLVQNLQYSVQFFPGTINAELEGLNFAELIQLTWTMVQSNYPEDWLTIKYEPFRATPLEIRIEVVKQLKELTKEGSTLRTQLDFLKPNVTIKDLCKTLSNRNALGLVHFAFSHGAIKFAKAKSEPSENADLKRLEDILAQQQMQNHFQILGLTAQAKSLEIHQSFINLAKAFHPDRVSPTSSEKLKTVMQSIFQNFSTAYEVLKDAEKKKAYIEQLKNGESQNSLMLEQTLEEIYAALESGRPVEAKKKYLTLQERDRKNPRVRILQYWIELSDAQLQIQSQILNAWFVEFQDDIPLEDRHSYLYFFIKGLFHLRMGEPQKAFKYFKHAIVVEPNFKPARMEFLRLKSLVTETPHDEPTVLTQFTNMLKKVK